MLRDMAARIWAEMADYCRRVLQHGKGERQVFLFVLDLQDSVFCEGKLSICCDFCVYGLEFLEYLCFLSYIEKI